MQTYKLGRKILNILPVSAVMKYSQTTWVAVNLTFNTRYYHSVDEGHTLKSISSAGANEPIMTVMSFATTMIC